MRPLLPRPIARFLAAGAVVVTVAGCGQNLVAPDSVVEGAGAEAFLDRIDKQCGQLHLGVQTVTYLLNFSDDDAYFIDITSKLYYGKISASTYADDINGNYVTGGNQPAIDCILSQLDRP